MNTHGTPMNTFMTSMTSPIAQGNSPLFIPQIRERTPNNVERVLDPFSYLLDQRIIMCPYGIDDSVQALLTAQMLYLDRAKVDDIYLYINSGGGSVTAGMGIINTMQIIKSDVVTVNMGMCASMGAMILTHGTRGKRMALENSWTMIHQPLYGKDGQITDVMIHAQWGQRLKKIMTKMLADCTGQTVRKVGRDIERDNFMTAQEALEYGLIDKILLPGQLETV